MQQEEKIKITQEKEYRMVGLSRSGNHGLINWIINQLNGSYCFLNCTEPKYNPFFTARPLSEKGEVYRTNIPDFNLEKEQEGTFSQKDYLLYNHEDCFLGNLNKRIQKEKSEEWLGNSIVKKDVLILRDPFNLFASRIKAGLIRGHYTHHGARPISILTLKRIYKQHAREYLGKKNYLRNKILINFNSWATEKEYRHALAKSLDIPFSDKGFKEVTEVAGGSSFDGINFSGNAHKMDVNNRWKKYASDEEYWGMFDDEMLELTRRIFGNIPPLEFLETKRKAAELISSSEEKTDKDDEQARSVQFNR